METVELAYDVYETEETQKEKCPIIFLHGLFWNKHMFSKTSKALCNATKRKVFCVDLRCHGKSPFREECSAELMAEDMKRFIKERKLEKVTIVAHSFSSTIAYLMTLDEPEIVEKIVMIDHGPYFPFGDENFKKCVLTQFMTQDRFLRSLDSSLSLIDAKKKILSICEGASKSQQIFLQKVAYDLTKENNQFKWKTNHDFLLKKYQEKNFTPTPRGSSNHEILIIRCSDSLRVTEEVASNACRFNPNLKVITINDGTHLLMFEKQEEFIAAVTEFLS